MNFIQTALWKSAFDNCRTDSTPEEQARLAACYKSMRARASSLVAKISSDLPFMTIHDVTHLDALWEMASIACDGQVDLNPAEAFVFGGAVLLHDASMTLAAFPGGVADLKQTGEWRDLHARHLSALAEQDAAIVADVEKQTTEDALRLLHAKHAENLPKLSWVDHQGNSIFIIENQQIRNFYGPKIGRIAYSHWWSIGKVESELAGTLGALPDVTNCTVDLLKVACLLRVADAMHLDQRRAPTFEFALARPKGISALHWDFQGRMAKPFIRGDALVYTAQPPFEVGSAEAWWMAFDTLQLVDRELRNVDRVLRDLQKKPLTVRRVDGAQSPSDLARTVETVGWTPVDSTIRVSDVPKIVATLGGSKLYENSVTAPIRELIQNGLDAIIARRRLQSRPIKWGELHVSLNKKDDGYWFCVEDNGVGMSTTVLTGPLIDFGNSFWRSPLAMEEFPGLSSAGMKARGKYGIGFFSVFMLADVVRVITRRYDRDVRSAKVLEFRNGLGSRPNMKEVDPSEAPIDGGTRVELKLLKAPSEPEGLLHQQNFYNATIRKIEDVIAAIAPATDVMIKIFSDGRSVGSIEPSDWLEVDSTVLLKRISQREISVTEPQSARNLVELRDEDGRIYGRARIEVDILPPAGLITVDGLTASKIGLISGVLIGVETTASRNTAKPVVPASVLAAWASEQAIQIATVDLTYRDKAKAACVVLACGGNPGDLPIVWWINMAMSKTEFQTSLESETEFIIHDGDITHDDEDDVTRRAFESTFEVKSNIAFTADSSASIFGNMQWISAVVGGKGKKPIHLIQEILNHVWGSVESREINLVVGEVNGIDIDRTVTVYSKMDGANISTK